jgi:hypothetical protein
MKIIIILFFSISLMQCFKLKDFCFYDPTSINNEFECHGKLSFNCGGMLCTKNQYSCQVLSLFSMLDGIHNKRFISFMDKIKDCIEPPKYKWNVNHLCLNTKECFKPLVSVWSFKMKPIKCKCKGKYSYNCNNDDYCGLNKHACSGLKKKMAKIRQCD